MTGDTKGGAEGHDEDPAQDDGNDSGLKDGADDDPKKRKVMIRLLTARLDKLVAKKDDACALVLSLPSPSSQCLLMQRKRSIKRLHGSTQQEDMGHLLQDNISPHEL
jgi:hypothetical protein